MTARLEEICPDVVGEQRIVLSLDTSNPTLYAHVPFQVNVNYDAALPDGITLPLELVLQGPIAGQRKVRIFRTARPNSVVLTPTTRGQHFISLRELHHNRWQGQLFVNVEGEDLQISEDR